jgi:hypothetical protein
VNRTSVRAMNRLGGVARRYADPSVMKR